MGIIKRTLHNIYPNLFGFNAYVEMREMSYFFSIGKEETSYRKLIYELVEKFKLPRVWREITKINLYDDIKTIEVTDNIFERILRIITFQ